MCVLRISGNDLDPAAALQGSTLLPYSTYRRGDLRFKKGDAQHETSGLKIDVSKAEWTDRDGQFQDALAFIRTHRNSLTKISKFPGVESMVLDFPFEATGWLTCVTIPIDLARESASLDIAVEISFYPPTEQASE